MVCRVNQNLNITDTLISTKGFFSRIQCWNAWIKLGKSARINLNTRCYLVKKKLSANEFFEFFKILTITIFYNKVLKNQKNEK